MNAYSKQSEVNKKNIHNCYMANKLYDDNYRRNFLRNSNNNQLNDYFKSLQKLSEKKGGHYTKMYNHDIQYFLDITEQRGGNLLDKLFGKSEKSDANEVCDTEAYINRINSIATNSYCSMVTQKTDKCDNRCVNRIDEMIKIKHVLESEKSYKTSGTAKDQDWIRAIQKFIDILICCSHEFSKTEYETFRQTHLKKITTMIIQNINFLKIAYGYLIKVLQNEKNKISTDFLGKYIELRKKKPTAYFNYTNEKNKLIGDYIKMLGPNGFGIIYTTKLVEKIIEAYKTLPYQVL